MTRLVGRAVRDFVAASPGTGTYAALLAGVLVESAVVPGVAALGAVAGSALWQDPATGAVLATGLAPVVGGLAVGYATGTGNSIAALGHPATYAYAILPLVARWLVLATIVDRLAGQDAVLVGDTVFLAGIVTPVAVVGVVAGATLAPAPTRTADADRADADRTDADRTDADRADADRTDADRADADRADADRERDR